MILGSGNYFLGERRFPTNVTTIFNEETGGWDLIGVIFFVLELGLVAIHDFEKYWWKQMVGSNQLFRSSFSGKLSCILISVFVVFIVGNSDQKYKIFSNQQTDEVSLITLSSKDFC